VMEVYEVEVAPYVPAPAWWPQCHGEHSTELRTNAAYSEYECFDCKRTARIIVRQRLPELKPLPTP
jgi:hypothetical protein